MRFLKSEPTRGRTPSPGVHYRGALLLLLLAAGCSGQVAVEGPVRDPVAPVSAPSGGEIVFTPVTRRAGINFIHSFGDRTFSNIVEAVGSGAVFADFDRDGWIDLYLATGKPVPGLSQGPGPAEAPLNRMYRNLGNGTFQDVTARAGVGLAGAFNTGVAAGDYDNDGYPDLYVCGFRRSTLFHNNGNGTFSDETSRAGVGDEGRSAVAAVWLDYDNDGLIDLYVANYLDFDPNYRHYYAPDGFPGPLSYRAEADRLYRNRGDGTFLDVTEASGLSHLKGRGMSVAAADYDQDGYTDIYVTNDAGRNFLLHNNGGKRFEEVGLESGVAFNDMGDSTASMAADFGDYNGDGRVDLFVSDNALSSLYENQGGGLFTDLAVESGIARNSAQFVGWGSFFFDFDNDGDLDLFKVNSDLSRLFGQEDQLLENAGQGRFRDQSAVLGPYFQRELLGRGAAYADYDNDGDLDVLILNLNGPPILLRNDGGNRGNWITLRLQGNRSNRDALGARIVLRAGGRQQVAFVRSSSGYLSQSDPRVHFGLGRLRRIERLEILWPSGEMQVVNDPGINQILRIEETRK